MKPISFSKLWRDRFPGWRATFTPTNETTPEMTRDEALAAAQPKIEANLAEMIKHIDAKIVARMAEKPDAVEPGRIRAKNIPNFRLLTEGEGVYMDRLAAHYARSGWILQYHRERDYGFCDNYDELAIRSAAVAAHPTPETLRKKGEVRFRKQLASVIQIIMDQLVAGFERDPTQESVLVNTTAEEGDRHLVWVTPDSHLYREVARHFGENGWSVVHTGSGIRFTVKAA